MRRLLILLPILCVPLLLCSQIRADFTYARFFAPEKGPYLETYLNFDAQSLNYDSVDGGWQAKIQVIIYFEQDSTIKEFKKYNVSSPVVTNKNEVKQDFIDQQRFALEFGKYEMDIEIVDLHGTNDTIRAKQAVFINDPNSTEIQFSDVIFLQDFSKSNVKNQSLSHSGYNFVPYVFDFFPTEVENLIFYTELYNFKAVYGDSAVGVIRYYLTDMKSGKSLDKFAGYNRLKANDVSVIFKTINISSLPAGNYQLRFDLLDRNGDNIKSQATNFYRINNNIKAPEITKHGAEKFEHYVSNVQSRDSLDYMMMCLVPIAETNDQLFIKKNRKTPDNQIIRNFIINFWLARNPENALRAWAEYNLEVMKVNKAFSSQNSPGYETDRGYIYLRYGEPNTIRKQENEPSSYPYHIWHYYKHPKRSDARYVFYSTELTTNDFRLLHSNVIGEVNNPRWQRDLQRRNTPFGTVDDEGVESQWGSWSEELFNMPR